MRKLLVGLMIAAMAMTSLVGCGSAGDSSQPFYRQKCRGEGLERLYVGDLLP